MPASLEIVKYLKKWICDAFLEGGIFIVAEW